MVGQECGTGCEWQSLRRRKTWRDGTAHKLDKDYVVSETQVYVNQGSTLTFLKSEEDDEFR